MSSKVPVGARVGAVLSANSNEVLLLGYGVYEGEHEPPFGPLGTNKAEAESVIAEMKASGELPQDFIFLNPRIKLDDGRTVWGAQCWWGAEDRVRASIGDRKVVLVTDEQPTEW